MDDRRDSLAYADTVKHVALSKDEPAEPTRENPRGVRLAAVAITKRPEGEDERRPDSAIREIPATASPSDPRVEGEPVPPLEVETDLD